MHNMLTLNVRSFLNLIFYFMYMGVLTVCLSPVHMPDARGGQKTGSNLLDLEFRWT